MRISDWSSDVCSSDLPDFRDVDVAISRTRAEYDGFPEVREIEQLYLDLIAGARRFIYFENQYFTCGKIAAAIAERLDEDDPPEFVMVMPKTADVWLEQQAMDGARVKLVRAIAKARHAAGRRTYVPRPAVGEPIYVPAKTAVVDDRLIRIGSSNMNNRSMGLDSECDVTIDVALPANRDAAPAITRLRESLIAEHLGVETADVTREFRSEEHTSELQSLMRISNAVF